LSSKPAEKSVGRAVGHSGNYSLGGDKEEEAIEDAEGEDLRRNIQNAKLLITLKEDAAHN
jgi:hypothetical protein